MFEIGTLAFLNPWFLTAFLGLPIVYWLLRATPPAPKEATFPPVDWLRDILIKAQTPQHTPWWLLLLRLLIISLIILAFAHPVTNRQTALKGNGPVLILVDNGWQSAHYWSHQQSQIDALLATGAQNDRDFYLMPLADLELDDKTSLATLLPAEDARAKLANLAPQPWQVNYPHIVTALETLLDQKADLAPAEAYWFVGPSFDQSQETDRKKVSDLLSDLSLKIQFPDRANNLISLQQDHQLGAPTDIILTRQTALSDQTVSLSFYDETGQTLHRQEAVFGASELQIALKITAPSLIKNRLSLITIDGQNHVGASLLLDEKWRRRPVGLVSSKQSESNKALLSELYYLERALSKTADIRIQNLTELLDAPPSVLILADIGSFSHEQSEKLLDWIESGGMLIQFAGGNLAEKARRSPLLPVKLRSGGRALGGAMSWSTPATLGEFPENSPLSGLKVPTDVTINRQVLAEPDSELPDKIWALLNDGTPLITAKPIGDGYTILIHTTANTDWSNLALSGLYVEILQRLVQLSAGILPAQESQILTPWQTLSAYGELETPPASASPLYPEARQNFIPSAQHPAGYYGTDNFKQAFNFTEYLPVQSFVKLSDIPQHQRIQLGTETEKNWLGYLLSLALILFFIDHFCLEMLRRQRHAKLRLAAMILGLFAFMSYAHAQIQLFPQATPNKVATSPEKFDSQSDEYAIAATGDTWLAFVKTGDKSLDDLSKNGLENLSRQLYRRTSFEPAGVVGVNVDKDELSFYPVLFWPISSQQEDLSDKAVENLNRYMRNGGLIVFDTRDANITYRGGSTANQNTLKRLVRPLDLPPITEIPEKHVLTKAFFLLKEFPGRFTGQPVWVQKSNATVNDGVSSVLVGGHDWLGAWAQDISGAPLYPAVPGGERQRELSFRFGINLMMYALTGNYKADQVHVPSILERLGQ